MTQTQTEPEPTETDTRGPREAVGERPDGPMSTTVYDVFLRANVGRNHCFAEGYEPDDAAVLMGYDRALHPWMHGRRPHDLLDRLEPHLETLRGLFGRPFTHS